MITHRQAEALWAALHEGSALEFLPLRRGHGRRLLYNLRNLGLIEPPDWKITPAGIEALRDWEDHHQKPLDPLTVGKHAHLLGVQIVPMKHK